jgi:hypothetical protein
MQTPDLIAALSRDAKSERRNVGGSLRGAWVAGLAVAVALFLFMLGVRADLAEAIATPWYGLKIVILAVAAVAAIPVAEALVRPGAVVPVARLLLPVALLGAAVVADLAVLGLADALVRLRGRNAVDCLMLVPLFAAPVLVATLIALRDGAPTRPVRAGLAAGLFSGAVGGVLYGLYCPDDSPLFVAAWYSIGIGVAALAGGLAGKVLLRW